MGRVNVECGDVRKVATNTPQDQPMRWAEHKARGEVTYVGWLLADQNGNACGCKCPACGEDLQAVNAGKDASHFLKVNTRGMFFRHPSGHQRKDCSFLVAKLAALHLLMERGEIDLPPPRRPGVHQGASGTTYTAEAVGRSWRGRITDKVWLDSQSATITIDGRTVLVQLQARPNLSSGIAVDGVITIRVDDPIVASWEPEKILQELRLNNGFSCWEKHWDDDELSAEAQRKAATAAEAAMDRIPSELGSLDGLSQLQKSETVLHAKVKEILSKAGRLRGPYCEQEVSRVMHDGSQKRLHVHIDSQSLTLSEVRLETPLQGLVPDVMCIAWSSRNPSERFQLLIEVAVTHRVDEAKRALIARHGLACIEIDLTLLTTKQRRITVDQLQSAVIDDVQCKSWVFNPALARMVKSKELELEREDNELLKAGQREKERQQWLDELSTERLIELLIPALKHYWLTEGYMSVDDGHELLPQEVAARLGRRGFKDADDTELLKKEGLLHCLDDIRSRHLSNRSIGEWSGLARLAEEPKLQKYITLGLIALKAYPLNISPEDMDRVSELRRKVRQSLDAEQRTYARPASHDALIGRLFPPMRDAVSMPYGTLTALREKIDARQAVEREKAEERARAEAERTAANRRELQIEYAQRQKAFVENEKRRQKLDGLLLRERVHTWRSDTSASTIEPVLRQFNVVRITKNYARSGMDVEALLRSAWESRARGHPFRLWISEQSEQDTAKAIMIVEALRTASLVF
jgi:hypothetical protein